MFEFSLVIDNIQRSISFRKSARAKRLILRDRMPKGFEIIMPQRASIEAAKKFFQDNFQWVCAKARENNSKVSKLIQKEVISILGNEYRLEVAEVIRGVVEIDGGVLRVPASPEGNILNTKLKEFLANHLTKYILMQAGHYAQKLGTKFNKVRIGTQQSRWGSCSSSKTLSFNLYLIFAPREVLDYVILHEVAHLLEMNHSDRFWQLVANITPDYQIHRIWLKTKGAELRLISL